MICHLQSDNLNFFIFMSKNWPSDPRVGYKSPSNLVELIQINLDFEDELEKFEGSFERDETSWSLLGPRVEVSLTPNILKGINIFTVDVIKDCPYKVCEYHSEMKATRKKIFILKVFEMMPCGTLKFQIAF